MTNLIFAPTGDFLIELMCWSLSMSFENLIAGVGFAGADGAFTGLDLEEICNFEVEAWVAAMLDRVVWHPSCCCLNLLRRSFRAIWTRDWQYCLISYMAANNMHKYQVSVWSEWNQKYKQCAQLQFNTKWTIEMQHRQETIFNKPVSPHSFQIWKKLCSYIHY